MLEYFVRTKKISKVGIFVEDLRPSSLIDSIMEFCNNINNLDPYVFHGDWKESSYRVNFPLLQYRNAMTFDGDLIATNLDTARKILVIPSRGKKFLYVWNMYEHLSLPTIDDIISIYGNSDLELIARSLEYAEILTRNFNTKVHIAPKFDSKEFESIIKRN